MTCVEPIRDKSKIEKIKEVLKINNRNYILFLLGINSGLRISDILKLKVSDIKNKKYIELIEQKTNKYKRFPITNLLKKELELFIHNKSENEYLFINPKSKKAISRIQAYRIINDVCKQVGIMENVGTHTLRKTFGYHFYQMNKDVALLQCIFNHSTPSVTLRYIGINQDIIDSKMNKFFL